MTFVNDKKLIAYFQVTNYILKLTIIYFFLLIIILISWDHEGLKNYRTNFGILNDFSNSLLQEIMQIIK